MIRNRTKNKTLHESPEWALTRMQHVKGFMFQKPRDRAIIFLFMPQRKVSLHMWFVFGSIDVIALDNERKVIAVKNNFKPWTFWNPGCKASVVIELPVGTINETSTDIGDEIEIPKPNI